MGARVHSEQDGVTANRRILVIDDSVLVVETVREALEEDGVEVEGVTDLASLDHAQRLDRFDLILIDVQMPAMFGDDVAHRQIAHPLCKKQIGEPVQELLLCRSFGHTHLP